jgi:hypothetical protein
MHNFGRRQHTTVIPAIILVAILWIVALVFSMVGVSARGVVPAVQVTDFAHFYTLGHLASSHQVSTLYDEAALREAHVALVPTSRDYDFPPLYPPQVALIFAPLSGLSYEYALVVWNVLTVAAYGLIVWSAWKPVSMQLPNRTLVFTAAAAFVPFLCLVLSGQSTVVILGAFWAGWLALERKRHLLAGMAFGLLAIKPQFGIPLAVVVLVGREWAMLGGALLSVALQASGVWLMLGWQAFEGFARALPITLSRVDGLETEPYLSHSIRALTQIAPDVVGVPLWVCLTVAVLWYTARLWRSQAPVRVRLGAVILASVLVSPHTMIYDLTVIALPLLWFSAYMQEPARREHSTSYWKTVHWLFAALVIQTLDIMRLQAPVMLMAWLLVLVTRAVYEHTAVDETSRPAAA